VGGAADGLDIRVAAAPPYVGQLRVERRDRERTGRGHVERGVVLAERTARPEAAAEQEDAPPAARVRGALDGERWVGEEDHREAHAGRQHEGVAVAGLRQHALLPLWEAVGRDETPTPPAP